MWEGQGDKKKMHLVKWSEVIKPNSDGGVSLGSVELKNRALLAKWWWRFREEKELCGGKLLLLSMVRMSGVGSLELSLGTGCQICRVIFGVLGMNQSIREML